MTVFIYHYFEHLQKKVLEKANIAVLTTGDCTALSTAILNKTKKSISETTLKRVYGFANTRFKPSSFTLNTLAQFCDYKNWEAFCSTVKNMPKENDYQSNIFAKADIISRNTLQALKNRSSIPYYHTIDRKVIHNHLSVFEDENYNATIVIGSSGSGKTIGLCHWLDGRLALNSVTNNDDIYLFFSSQLLNNAILHEDSLEQWLLNLLGVQTTQDISLLFSNNNRKFYLIIDGFDEYLFKPYQFENIFNQIIDVVSRYKDMEWFKLILTMTSVTWSSYKSVVSQFHIIRDKWFLGLMHDDQTIQSNITSFSYDELILLAEKINPHDGLPKKLPEDVVRFLGHPEYFTYFYHFCSGKFSLHHAKSAHIYKLIAEFVFDKIYSGRNSTEKVTLIDSIVKNIKWQKNKTYAHKSDVQMPIKTQGHAYRDLLNYAVLSESNKSNPLEYKETVEFINNDITRYFLAKAILADHNKVISQKLVQDAQFVTIGTDDYLGVLKWIITHALHSKDFKIFNYISTLKLYPTEKISIFIFICDTLDQSFEELYSDKGFNNFLQQDFNFFNSYIKTSYIDQTYTNRLKLLLRFDLPQEKILLIRCLLATAYLLEADTKNCQHQIECLSKISDDVIQNLPYNPVIGIKTIYQYFVSGNIEIDSLKEITYLLFNANYINKYKQVYENHFMNAIYVSMLFNNYRKTARFIDLLRNTLPKINESISTELRLWMSIMECRSAIFTDNSQHAHRLYKYITNRYQHDHDNFTSSMRLSYFILKTQAISFLHLDGDLLLIEKQVTSISQKSQYFFYEIVNKSFLVNTKSFNHLSVEEIQKIHITLTKLLRLKGFRTESFIFSFQHDLSNKKFKRLA